jgi:predicted PurR-regulated permease PerM
MKKTRYLAVALILILLAASIVLFFLAQNYKGNYQQLKIQVQDITARAKDYQLMQERIASIEKSAKGENRGVSAVISDLVSDLGIQSKLESVKNIEQKNFLDLFRQDAELVINGLDINEAVNLLYAIEKENYPLSLRAVEMSHKFESSDFYNLRLVISYFQKK